jgi:hypothetical protein
LEGRLTSMSPRLHDLLLGLVCFLVYLALHQESGYGDGPGAILEIHAGNAFQDPVHFLYMPMVLGMSKLLGWLGLSLFEVGYVTSALGTAIGIGFLGAATRKLAPEDSPLLVAGLAACCPAVLFFATAVEYHGPFFAYSSLATYAMVCMVKRPHWSRAVLVGLTTGIAFLAHATAHLLPLFLVLCFDALSPQRPRAWRRLLRLAALVAITHVAVVALLTISLNAMTGAGISSGRALGWLGAGTDRPFAHVLTLLAPTFWYEILWPYLLLSVTWLCGFRSRAQRPLAIAALLILWPYFVMCMVLVPNYNEHGAYQLPLAWLLALITVRSLPRPVVMATLACTAVLAVVQVQLHDKPEPARSYGRGVQQVAQQGPVCLIIGKDFVDYEACALYLLDTVEAIDIAKIGGSTPAQARAALVALDRDLQDRWSRGQQVILSAGAWQTLTSPIAQSAGGPLVPMLKTHLETHYRLEQVSAEGFRGWRVQPR